MPMQPSASRTDLLLACPRPFEVDEEERRGGEPARYGSAFHQIIAACLAPKDGRNPKPLEKTDRYAKIVDKAATAYDVRGAVGELAGHVKSSLGVLRNWLAREKLQVEVVEGAFAVKVGHLNWASRPIASHDEDHRYDVEPGELPGTVDLIATNNERVVVIDHKTGSGDEDTFAQPTKIPQMQTLSLMAALPSSMRTVEAGIFHADRRGLPNIYHEPIEFAERRTHASALHKALTRIGEGWLRIGPHCGRCPVRITCPAHRAELLSEGTNALVTAANQLAAEPIDGALVSAKASKLPVETRAGLLYELLKKFSALEKVGREEIRRLVKAGAIIEVGGKTLGIRTQKFETLSKKSVLAAYGEREGEKMLEKLRKKGAIVEGVREQLVPEKD